MPGSPQRKPDASPARIHNGVLRAATLRALALEDELVKVLVPILDRAAEVASLNFQAFATRHHVAAAGALTAAVDVQPTSTMICLKPRPEQADAIADTDGYPPENLHVTLAYLGEMDGPLEAIAEAVRPVAAEHGPLAGVVGGYAQFETPGGPVGVLLPDVPGLVELRVAVTEALVRSEITYARSHGFQAHITVDDEAEPDELAKMLPLSGSPLNFDELLVVRGDVEIVRVALVGRPPLTASLTAAAGDRRFCLPAELNAKTEPVRSTVVETVASASLEPLRISYDVTNPFIAKVIDQAGRQITHVARTTQRDVMKAVKSGYEQGLSIPDTAKLIESAMKEANLARATLIARTELAGAVNGASVASMKVVASALGDEGTSDGGGDSGPFRKQWLTAPGATYPRHETYDGLDGQEQNLDDPFDVEGTALMYPGDPDGPPDEICNCFVGSTLVVAPGLQMGFRRRYEGDLVRVEVLGVGHLAGTPNHPVLTGAGWKPLGLLREGDYLVCALPREEEGAVDPDVDHAPSPIHQVFGALARREVPRRIRGRAVQFHGDSSADGEVEVVPADGDLGLRIDPAFGEQRRELELGGAGEAAARFSPTSLRLELRIAGGAGPAGGVRGGRELLPAVGARLAHPQAHRVGAAARDDADVTQRPVNDPAADGVELGERLYGRAFEVSLAQVVVVERNAFHGDVFNLQTESGTYLANGIVSHNCRCTLIYVDSGGAETDAPDDAPDLTAAACEHHTLTPYAWEVEAELETLCASMTAAGAAGWTAPAPAEILNVDCAPAAPERVVAPTPAHEAARYDARLLPEWSRTPVEQLTPEQAKAEAKRLQWARNSLNHRLRKVGDGDAAAAQIKAKVEAANARLDELKARAAGRAVQPPPPPPPPPPPLPPPKPVVLPPGGERPFAHYAKATLNTQIARSRSTLRDLLAKDTLTGTEQAEYARHEERLRQLLVEREYRKAHPDAVPAKKGKAATAVPLPPPANERVGWLRQQFEARTPPPSSTLQASAAWEERVRSVGAEFRKEVEQRLEGRGEAPPGLATSLVDRERRMALRGQSVQARRLALVDVLNEIRGAGGGDKNVLAWSGQAGLRNTLDKATQFFPAGWLSHINGTGRGINLTTTARRGYFRRAFGAENHEIAVSFGDRSKVLSDPSGFSTAIHELGHLMEQEIPGVRKAEAAFYARRTYGQELKKYRWGKPGENVRSDEFVDEYMGKDYDWRGPITSDSATEMPNDLASYEILSMGMEALFTGSFAIWDRDPDMVNFILGLLVSV